MADPAWFIDPNEDNDFNAYQAEQTQRESYAAQYTPDQARNTALMAATYPNMQAGITTALGVSGVPANSDIAQSAAATSEVVKKKRKGLAHRLFNGTVRQALTTLEAPYQYGTGLVRSTIAASNGSREDLNGNPWAIMQDAALQTNLGMSLAAVREGVEVDQGEGFFTSRTSDIGRRQAEASRQALMVDGHAATLGRGVAHALNLEPDDDAYRHVSGTIDAISLLGLDPTTYAGGGFAKARNAKQSFAPAAGLFQGNRKVVLQDMADEWLNSKSTNKFVDWAAKNGDFDDIWRKTNKQWDVDFAAKIADTDNPAEIRALLKDQIASGKMRDKPYVSPFQAWSPLGSVGEAITDTANAALSPLNPVGGLGSAVADKAAQLITAPRGIRTARRFEDIRLFNSIPGEGFVLGNANQVVKNLDATLHNAKMDGTAIAEWNGKLARATEPEDRRTIILDAMADMRRHVMEQSGMDTATSRKVTKLFADIDPSLRKFNVDEMLQNTPVKSLQVDGAEHGFAGAHLFNEGNHEFLPGLSRKQVVDIRTATGALANNKWFNPMFKAGQISERALQPLTNVWKPMALLRAAYTVRVVGEEQVRMAASGLTSMANNPLSAIAWAISDKELKTKIPGLANEFDVGELLAKAKLTGRGERDIWGDKFVDDASNAFDDFRASQNVLKGGDDWVKRQGHTSWMGAAKGSEHYEKGVAEELHQLRNDPIAARVAGGLSPGDLVTRTGNDVEDTLQWFTKGAGQSYRNTLSKRRGWEKLKDDDDVAREYIQSIADRINLKTGKDAELRELVATGMINGKKADGKAVKDLISLKAADDTVGLPANVKVSYQDPMRIERSNKTVNFLFDHLMTKPTNFLSRSPAFRQFYWTRVEELLPSMSREAQEAVLKAARGTNLERKRIGKLEKAAKSGNGEIDLKNADIIAKSHGLDKTQDLLYNASEKSQLFDQMRLIFPFGEAWKEVMTVWAGIGRNNPAILNTAHKGVQGARNTGFFSTDANGNETFTIPLTGRINKKITGVDAPFKGTVAGLNIFSSNPLLPGVSPFVSWPVAKMIPNRPEFDGLKKMIAPMGTPDTEGGVVESFMPAWVKKIYTGAHANPQNDRDLNTAVGRIMADKLTTGAYSTESPEEIERLYKDSVTAGRQLFVLRGLTQFWSPTAPSPKWMAHDKENNLVTVDSILKEYNDLKQADYDTADEKFLDTYGEKALLYMQPLTSGGFSPIQSLYDFARENPAIINRYKNSYGFLAPDSGEYSPNEQERQVLSGERDILKPKEQIELANNRIATLKYNAARDQLGGETPTAEQRAWLNNLKDALKDDYPGYNPDKLSTGKQAMRIDELKKAVDDPELQDNEIVQVMKQYMTARAQVEAQDPSFAQTKRSTEARAWLREIGNSLSAENPTFTRVWQDVLETELKDDSSELVVTDPNQETING